MSWLESILVFKYSLELYSGVSLLFSCKSALFRLWLSAWASYQIRKIAGCACAGNAGNVSPRRRIQRKTRVSYPGMHHGTCVTHVPWCMSGLLTRGGGIPGACAPAILRIWQEAHWMKSSWSKSLMGIQHNWSNITSWWHSKNITISCTGPAVCTYFIKCQYSH